MNRVHLKQIQSTDKDQYLHLFDQLIEMSGSLEVLLDNAIKKTYNTFAALSNDMEKTMGFYRVLEDETYRNKTTEYYFDGQSLHLLNTRIPSGSFKKTVVFYIKEFEEEGQSMSIHVPYAGRIASATIFIGAASLQNLVVEIEKNGTAIATATLETETTFKSIALNELINHEPLTLRIVSGEQRLQNINVNIQILLDTNEN